MSPSTSSGPGVVKLSLAQNAYERLQSASTKDSLSFEEVIGSNSMSETLQKVASYQQRLLATKSESPNGHLFINGKYHPFANVRTQPQAIADSIALDILGSERIGESSIIPTGTAAIGLYDLGCFQLLLRSTWCTDSTKQDHRTDHGGACFEDCQST